ncbi:transcription factor bHLH93-like [Argentina anserina]|uniref:transcription factor bHLH93-like n=1 Tax=Argentina anserina TaxID=57926 RepID=UPI00217625AE|nr:transcription factor bHLH93-like [Potentilla anserina]
MELNEHSFLEELLAFRRDSSWETILPEINEFLSSSTSWSSFDYFNNQIPSPFFLNSSSSQEFSPPFEPNLNNYHNSITCFNEGYYPLGIDANHELLSAPQVTTDSSYNTLGDTPPFPVQEDSNPWSMFEQEELSILGDEIHNLETQAAACKVEQTQSSSSPEAAQVFNMGMRVERNSRASKKLQGQPSKNLMAERRRRKRLNDRLSMLRSIVPKISKMDRTSILGDTIDYMKELLDKINNLQHETEEEGSDQLNVMRLFKDKKPNEMLVRNSPKFDVQRRNVDTRIEICCAGKPGLLLSTVTTLEALGLEIQQCVISCFNDFAMQASCSEGLDQGTLVTSEDMKQALFRNAGYGGRCL